MEALQCLCLVAELGYGEEVAGTTYLLTPHCELV